MIAPGDVDLFRFVETAEEAWDVLAEHYGFEPATPRPAAGCDRRRHLEAAMNRNASA